MATTNIFHVCSIGIDCILCSEGMDLPDLMCPQFEHNFGCFVVAGCCIIYIIEVRRVILINSSFGQPLSLPCGTSRIFTGLFVLSPYKLPTANLLCENDAGVHFYAADALTYTPVSQDDPDQLSVLENSPYGGNQWLTSPSPNNKKYCSQGKYICVVKYHLLPLYLQYISNIRYFVTCKMPLVDNLRHPKPSQDPCMKMFSIGNQLLVSCPTILGEKFGTLNHCCLILRRTI